VDPAGGDRGRARGLGGVGGAAGVLFLLGAGVSREDLTQAGAPAIVHAALLWRVGPAA
jgi:hypothetical protein